MLLLEAFAHEEGYYKPGSRPQRNNNPLDLMAGVEATKFGAIAADGRYAIFPNAGVGFLAGRRWLSVPAHFHLGEMKGFYYDKNGTTLVAGYLGATMAQVVHRFAPADDNNDPEAYLDYLCTNVPNITPKTILTLDLLLVPNVTGFTK